jgi:NAD(P)H dehydrogenase (quinone)
MSNRIVVTGATGTIGRRTSEGLLGKRANVTVLVRDAAKGAPFAERGARVVVGSFEDRRALAEAFADADTVVSITPSSVHAGEQTSRVFAAAKESGVRKIVRISAVKANPEGPTDNTRQHGRTEAELAASGMTYVIFRPSLFFQNLLGSLPTILGEGKLYFGLGKGRVGMIDTRDVADAAVVAATSSLYDGSTLELSGPESIDYDAVAAAIGRGLGRAVAYVPVPPVAAGEAMRGFGADDWTVGVVRDYCAAYSKGFGDFTTGEVARVTGHPPRSVDDFVREVLVPAAQR